MEIYAANLQDIDKLSIEELLTYVSIEKRKRVKKFFKKADAYKTLLGEILIRGIICAKLKINNNEIKFNRNKYGKPFIKEYYYFHFNISHSGNWVVVAVDKQGLGIDIERVKLIDFGIAKQFFSNEEYQNLQTKVGKYKLDYFYQLWTLKESYIKAIGNGLSIPLSSFTIKIGDNINVISEDKASNCFFKQYNDLDSNYKLAICASNNYFPENIIIKNTKRLIMSLKNCLF